MSAENLKHQRWARGNASCKYLAVRKFTMIELLVVISIIAILASLLLPTLSKAKKMAEVAVCTSQLKQLAQCEFEYVDDYKGFAPPTGGGTNDWSFQLQPYFSPNAKHDATKTTQITSGPLTLCWCPSTKVIPGTLPKYVYFPTSYGQNLTVYNYPFYSGVNGRLARASSLILHIDNDAFGPANSTTAATLSAHRHNGKWNSSFMDGHVEMINLGMVSSSTSYY